MLFRGAPGIPHVPPLFFKELAKLCLEVLDLSLEFGFVTLFRCEASRHGSMRVGNGVFRVGGGWHGRARRHGLTVRVFCLKSDVYFLGVKTHKNIYNGKKDKNAIKNQDKSSPLARVM